MIYTQVLQHVPFEGPAAIASILRARGGIVHTTRLWEGESLEGIGRPDLLVVMGGPMSVNDIDRFPWLAPEIEAVKAQIAAGTPVLGVCLGAQLIARALGASVYRGRQPEIGWWPVEFDGAALPERLRGALPARMNAMHWHGETFDLPTGAIRFASSPIAANQAFLYGDRIIGLQFHLESTALSVAQLLAAAAGEIGRSTYQPVRHRAQRDLVDPTSYHTGSTRPLLASILDYLLSRSR